jgi:hypothetical protein
MKKVSRKAAEPQREQASRLRVKFKTKADVDSAPFGFMSLEISPFRRLRCAPPSTVEMTL